MMTIESCPICESIYFEYKKVRRLANGNDGYYFTCLDCGFSVGFFEGAYEDCVKQCNKAIQNLRKDLDDREY